MKRFLNARASLRGGRARISTALFAPLVLILLLLSPGLARAANPASGSISHVTTTTLNWNGTAMGTGAVDPASTIEGVNSDTFTLNITGNLDSWKGKCVSITISWPSSTNDYDLYVRKPGSPGFERVSGGGVPQTNEAVLIDPYSSGLGTYTVQTVYFACTPATSQYKGSAKVMPKPVAQYFRGGISFSPNVATRAPGAGRDGEPSTRVDKFGNAYVAGIRGVPAGVDMWYFDLNPSSRTFDPRMRNPLYRGQPDAFISDQPLQAGADGGGDVDLAVGFDNATPGNPPYLAFTSLTAANISAARSTDRGVTWLKNPLGNVTGGPAVDDRQWIEFYGRDKVYLLYRTLAPAAAQVQCSLDGGLTYGPAAQLGLIGQVGNVSVDQNDGTVYASGSIGVVCVGIPPAPGLPPTTYTTYKAAEDPNGVDHIFFVVKCGPDGTVYVCYSNGTNVFVKYSKDKAKTWSAPLRVNQGTDTRTAMLPWMECGPQPGTIGVVWYGAHTTTNEQNSKWNVYFAHVTGANTELPVVRTTVVSDHMIHAGKISEMGLDVSGEGDNRNLLDYFQIAFDPLGAAVIAYTGDNNDFDGHTFVARQLTGPSAKGGKLPAVVEGPDLPPPPTYSASAPQVVDFAQDVEYGLLGRLAQNDSVDIVSIQYLTEGGTGGPYITAKIKVSELNSTPVRSTFRASFAANVPGDALSTTLDYNFGLVDLGDQFYIQVTTNNDGTPTYTWGTAVRNNSGSISYTSRGAADGGSFDPASKTITLRVKKSKVDAVLAAAGRRTLTIGSPVSGLRGMAFTAPDGGLVKFDGTRGGTRFHVKH